MHVDYQWNGLEPELARKISIWSNEPDLAALKEWTFHSDDFLQVVSTGIPIVYDVLPIRTLSVTARMSINWQLTYFNGQRDHSDSLEIELCQRLFANESKHTIANQTAAKM